MKNTSQTVVRNESAGVDSRTGMESMSAIAWFRQLTSGLPVIQEYLRSIHTVALPFPIPSLSELAIMRRLTPQ